QRHQQIRAIDVSVEEIRLMQGRLFETREGLVGPPEIPQGAAEQCSSGCVLRRDLDRFAQLIDRFRGTLELAIREAEQVERIHVLWIETEDLRIAGCSVCNGTTPVQVQRFREQTGCERVRHVAARLMDKARVEQWIGRGFISQQFFCRSNLHGAAQSVEGARAGKLTERHAALRRRGGVSALGSRYSALAPESLTSAAQTAISRRMNAVNSCGEPGLAMALKRARFSFISVDC